MFLLPWIFGLVVLFLYPLIESLLFSFSNVGQADGGGLTTTFTGFQNYINVLNTHTKANTFFKIELLTTIGDALINLPVIVIFSLIIATILNTEFKGRAIKSNLLYSSYIKLSNSIRSN